VKRLLLLLAVCLTLGLVACSGDKSDSGDKDPSKDTEDYKKSSDAKEKATIPICPQVVIVAQLDEIRDYGAEKPDPVELVAQAKLLSVDGTCAYETREAGQDQDGIDVAFDLNMVAARGPRLGGLHASFPFFAAVVDPRGTILNKEPMTTEFGFASDQQIARRAESLHVFIPLAKDKQSQGPDYQVLLGFQLTKEQYAAMEAPTP